MGGMEINRAQPSQYHREGIGQHIFTDGPGVFSVEYQPYTRYYYDWYIAHLTVEKVGKV